MLPHRVEARQQYAATPAGAEAHRRAKERYADANKEAILKKAREADGERREAMRDSGRRYARSEKGRAASQRATLAHPDRRAARVAVSNAVRDGGLIPMRCEICGAKGEAHHVHYEYPLLVTWLCSKHHKQAHAETIELEQRQQLQ